MISLSRLVPAQRWLSRGRGHNVLLGGLHVIQLLAHLRQTRLQLVHRIMQRLHLAGNLVHLAGSVIGLRAQGFLQVLDGSAHLVHVVSLLGDQVAHCAHAFVKRLLHAGHVVLHDLELCLDLDELRFCILRGQWLNHTGGKSKRDEQDGKALFLHKHLTR